jgi:hypothetical protein
MLAWVHQAIAAEREFLESLFAWRGGRGDGRMVGSVRVFAKRRRTEDKDVTGMGVGGDGGGGQVEEEEEEEWMAELMDLAVTKLCVPLRVCWIYGYPSYQLLLIALGIAAGTADGSLARE